MSEFRRIVFTILTLAALAPWAPSLGAGTASDAHAAEREVEAFVREYYRRMEGLDYAELREMSVPELEIISMSLPDYEIFGEGLQIGHEEFERQIEAAGKAGRELQFQLTQFNTKVHDRVAYTSYMMYRAGDDQLGLGEMILLRDGDRWRLARLVHTAFLPGYPE